MDEKRMICKAAQIQSEEVSAGDLAKINRFALKDLTADEIFVFKAVAGDNHTDDRNFEPFSLRSIEDMAKVYPGKPLMFDHSRRGSQNAVVGKVFDAYTEEAGEINANGEIVKRLILKMYVLRTDKNADLIKEIEAGIRSAVSTSTQPEKLICSICGVDNTKDYCHHWPGVTYNGKTCLMTIDGVKDAFELSFVYQGSQPRARTIKAFNPELPDLEFEKDKMKMKAQSKEDISKSALDIELFLMAESLEGDANE